MIKHLLFQHLNIYYNIQTIYIKKTITFLLIGCITDRSITPELSITQLNNAQRTISQTHNWFQLLDGCHKSLLTFISTGFWDGSQTDGERFLF